MKQELKSFWKLVIVAAILYAGFITYLHKSHGATFDLATTTTSVVNPGRDPFSVHNCPAAPDADCTGLFKFTNNSGHSVTAASLTLYAQNVGSADPNLGLWILSAMPSSPSDTSHLLAHATATITSASITQNVFTLNTPVTIANASSVWLFFPYYHNYSGTSQHLTYNLGSDGGNGSASNGWMYDIGGGGVWDVDWSDILPTGFFDDGAPTGPTISFTYPITSSTTPPFSPWLVHVAGLTATSTYQVSIHWQPTKVGSNIPWYLFWISTCEQAGTCALSGVYADNSISFGGNSSGTVAIDRSNRNLNYPNDGFDRDDWEATAYLMDLGNGSSTIVATSTVEFTMLRYAGNFSPGSLPTGDVATSTFITPSINASGTLTIATSTSNFAPQGFVNSSTTCPSDTLGLCGVIGVALKPSTAYQDAFNQQYQILLTRFPISLVYTVIAQASSSLLNGTDTYPSLSLTFPAAFGAPSSSIEVINDHMFDTVGMPAAMKATYFNLTEKVLWLSTALGAITIPFL